MANRWTRLPIWLLFPYHKTGYYVDVRTNPCYVPIFEKSKQCAIMLDRRNPRAALFAPEVTSASEKFEQDGWKVDRWTLSCNGRQLVSETRTRGDERIVKKLLESEEDLDLLLTFPINNDPACIAAELDRQAPQYLAEKAEFPPDYGSMMLDLGEPISFLYRNSNLEEFALWSLMCSRKVEQFLDAAMENYRHVYRYCLERRLGGCLLHGRQ